MLDSPELEELEVLSRREAFLETLQAEPLQKPALAEAVGQSRSTVDRAIRALEEAGFVTRKREGYVPTQTGRLALKRYRRFLAEQEAISAASDVLTALPAEPELRIELIETADVERFDSSYQLFERLADRLADARRYRAVLPDVVDTRQLRLCHARAVEGTLDVELLVAADRLAELRREFPMLCSELIDAATVRTLETPPPFALLFVTGGDESPDSAGTGSSRPTELLLAPYDGDDVRGVFSTSVEGSLAWANAYYDELSSESQRAAATLADGGAVTDVPTLTGAELPRSLRSEGFVRLDADYFTQREPMAPTTAWRAGLDLPEVQAGYAIDRRIELHGEVRSLTDELFEQLEDGSDVALLGPPGSGKSTVCKQVACAWRERTAGTVLYRESGRGDPLTSVTTVETLLGQASGPVLVVVEDAIRGEANAVFELVERFHGRDDVAFLFDARANEWHEPEEYPIDARLEAIRQEHVETVRLPALSEADCERLIDRVGEITDEELAVSPATLLADIRETARESSSEEEGAEAGVVFLLFHRLARTIDPLAEYDDPSGMSVLDEHVDRVRSELAGLGETALEVGILANLCNAAGLGLDPAYLHAPALADEGTFETVRDALERLEGALLFGEPTAGEYRALHEAWSVAFLDRLAAARVDATERFGAAVTALLSIADSEEQRAELVRRVGETAALDRIAVDPADWASETVETIFELGQTRPRLAPLFERDGTDPITLPEVCPADVERRRTVWLGELLLRARQYGRAEAVFDRVPDADDELAMERLLGLSRAADRHGKYEESKEYARRCRDLATDIGNEQLLARSHRQLGLVAWREGSLSTAREQVQDALELYRDQSDRYGEAGCLNLLGLVLMNDGALGAAREHYQRSLEIRRDLGHRAGEAKSLHNLGLTAGRLGEHERARDYQQRSLEIYRELGDRNGEAKSLNGLGSCFNDRNELEKARTYYERSLEIKRELGDRAGEANSLGNLGLIARQRGGFEAAEEYHRRSLGLKRELGDRHGEANSLGNLGFVARARGDLDDASQYLQQARDRFEEVGDHHRSAGCLRELGTIARYRDDLDTARERYRTALSMFLDVGDDRSAAQCLVALGVVALREGDLSDAAERLRDAIDRFEELDDTPGLGLARGLLGAVELREGQGSGGRERLDDALSTVRETGNTKAAAELLRHHIEAELRLNNERRALELHETARDWIERSDETIGYEREQIESLRAEIDHERTERSQ